MTNKKTPTVNDTAHPIETQAAAPSQFNAITGKAYHGAKAKRLQETARYHGYSETAWATMKQWNSAKETIARGQKGTLIVFLEKKPDGTEEQKRSFLFNRCQLESAIPLDTGDKPF